jgi:hypothetical protein
MQKLIVYYFKSFRKPHNKKTVISLETFYTLQIISLVAPMDANLPLEYDSFGYAYMGISFLSRWDTIFIKLWDTTLPATVLYSVLVLTWGAMALFTASKHKHLAKRTYTS